MLVRLATEADVEIVVAMARDAVETTKPHHVFSEAKLIECFARYLVTANPTFFLVERRGEVIGFLQAEIGGYDFTDGLFTVQKTLYVRPESRGSRAAAVLMSHLVEWSRGLGAKEIFGGVDNGFHVEQTSRFLERFRFRRNRYFMVRDLGDVEEGRGIGESRSSAGEGRRAGPSGAHPQGHGVHRQPV